MQLDPEGSGGLLPPTPPEEVDPGAVDAATKANTDTVEVELNKSTKPKGGVI
jgi:hypothetical protein